jgi:hypothetical protein
LLGLAFCVRFSLLAGCASFYKQIARSVAGSLLQFFFYSPSIYRNCTEIYGFCIGFAGALADRKRREIE